MSLLAQIKIILQSLQTHLLLPSKVFLRASYPRIYLYRYKLLQVQGMFIIISLDITNLLSQNKASMSANGILLLYSS